jgi:hypothetical protein
MASGHGCRFGQRETPDVGLCRFIGAGAFVDGGGDGPEGEPAGRGQLAASRGSRSKNERWGGVCALRHGCIHLSHGALTTAALGLPFDDEVGQLHQEIIGGAIGETLQCQLRLFHIVPRLA